MSDGKTGLAKWPVITAIIAYFVITAVVAYSFYVRRLLLGLIAAGIVWYFTSGRVREDGFGTSEPDTEVTDPENWGSSLVYGPSGTVRTEVPEGTKGSVEYLLYAADRRPATVETERVSDPPSYVRVLRNFVDTLGYGERMVPNDAEPPEKVLHEVKRQVRKDIDSGKVRTEPNETRVSSSEDDSTKIGFCELEADEEEGGFRYSVSYDSRYFDWEADSEIDDASVSG